MKCTRSLKKASNGKGGPNRTLEKLAYFVAVRARLNQYRGRICTVPRAVGTQWRVQTAARLLPSAAYSLLGVDEEGQADVFISEFIRCGSVRPQYCTGQGDD